jgi:hypothetical protein
MSAKFRELFLGGAIISFAALTARPSPAQSRMIRGVLTDEAGAAIPKTSIEISCTKKGHVTKVESTLSGTDGGFQLEATLFGACKISFSAAGFKLLHRSIRGSGNRSMLDLGTIRLRVSGCSDPGIICDEVTPANPKP